MKLAEALENRADLKRKISQLTDRIENNVLVQEGEKPLEDPAILKQQLDEALEQLSTLITQINITNCMCKVDGKSLTELIARKDALTSKISCYKSIIQEASRCTYRARNSEIKILPVIHVRDWQAQLDAASKELRIIDNKLQETNWTIELIQ